MTRIKYKYLNDLPVTVVSRVRCGSFLTPSSTGGTTYNTSTRIGSAVRVRMRLTKIPFISPSLSSKMQRIVGP